MLSKTNYASFLKPYFTFFLLIMSMTQIHAADQCGGWFGSSEFTANLTAPTDTYTQSGRIVNGWWNPTDSYYVRVPAAGTVHIEVTSNGNKVVFNYSENSCPNNYGGSTSRDVTFSGPADFNLLLFSYSDRDYTLTITFTAAGNTAPTINAQTFSVSETASSGTAVGYVLANDTDGTIQLFSITSGNGSGTFGINNSGLLTVADSSQLSVGTYYLTVQVTDDDGATDSATITVNVTAASSGGNNAGYRDFTLRKQLKLPGNMVTIGNTLMVAPNNSADNNYCSTYTNGTYIENAGGYNSDYFMCQYHLDKGTEPATSAQLSIPTPANSTLEWAGLYWQALVKNDTPILGMSIKIKKTGSAYVSTSYDQLDYMKDGGTDGYTSYSAFKDVTNLFKSQGWLDGTYVVADIPVHEGKAGGLGTYGAWTLVVIYRNNNEKLRSFSVFDGWKMVANEDDHRNVYVNISGFYTPKNTEINSSVSVFAAEGDKRILYDKLWAKPSKKNNETWLTHASDEQTFNSAINPSNFSRIPKPGNNLGIDIQTFELGSTDYNILEPEESLIQFRFTSNQDTYWPSMIAFNTELYEPDICYDYSYEQLGRYFTEENNGTAAPYIRGNIVPDQPITVGIYFRNNEDSDVKATNALLRVSDIGTTSDITLINNSTEVTYAGATDPVVVTPASQNAHSFTNLNLGDIDGQEYIYAYYQIDPHGNTEINIPLNADINYTLNLKDASGAIIPISYQADLGSGTIPLCRGAGGGTGYEPLYGDFNVEDPALYQAQKYNLYTQVSGRPWDAFVVSYTYGADRDYNDRNTTASWVKVELIDAGGYHDPQASCTDRETNITSPVAFYYSSSQTEFGDPVSSIDFNTILSAQGIDKERYYNVAVEEAAYRVWYLMNPYTGEMLQPVCSAQTPLWTFFKTDDGKQLLKDTQCTSECNAAASACETPNGNNSGKNLDGCLECLYPKLSVPVCSRDNFAIRPESFVTRLIDDNTSTPPRPIALSKNPSYNEETINLAGGYPYRYDVNATSHATGIFGDRGVRGYINNFGSFNLSTNRAYMSWTPTSVLTTAGCNAPVDQNMSFVIQDGTTYDSSLTWMSPVHQKLTNVGEYTYKVEDSRWTHVDYDPNYLTHHSGGYFLGGTDCIQDSSTVPSTNVSGGADANNIYTDPAVGCRISSVHKNVDTDDVYVAFKIRAYPYAINVSGVNDTDTGKIFYYMNNVAVISPLTDGLTPVDENHSVHLFGPLVAIGKDESNMTNFVQDCYGEPVVFDYNASVTSAGGYPLRWRETNSTTDTNDITAYVNVLPISGSNAFIKENNGSTILDLHINFDRSRTTPVNPVDLDISTIRANCSDNASTAYCQTNADGVNDHQALSTATLLSRHWMLYGRVHAPRYRVECSGTGNCSTTTTPNQALILYDEFYYDLNSTIDANSSLTTVTNLSSGINRSVDSINWYTNFQHGSKDGNATQVVQYYMPGASPISVISGPTVPASGRSTLNVTYDGTDGYPYKATMGITASPWLIYNRFDAAAIHNDFELEFNAAQLGEDSSLSDSNLTSPNTSRRIRW